MSKWRRHLRSQAVAVIRDGLEGCGLWSFRFYDFKTIDCFAVLPGYDYAPIQEMLARQDDPPKV